MRNQLLIFAASALLFACSGPTENTNTTPEEPLKPWVLDYASFEANEDTCPQKECTFIQLSIPTLSGGSNSAREKINNYVDSLCRSALKAQLPENIGNASYDILCESFIEGYTLFQMEFPDSKQKWSYIMNAESSVLSDAYFTLILSVESYLGGAHPNTQVSTLTFDLSSGNLVDPLAGYDKAAMMDIGERYFRRNHQMESATGLNDSGFMFEDGDFALPENIALLDSGLLFTYNTYEVASYAEGGTTFVLPFDSLAEFKVD